MRFSIAAASAITLGAASVPLTAAHAEGDNTLRGEWDLNIALSEEDASAVRLYVDEIATDPADSSARLATGCLEALESGVTTPASLRAIDAGGGVLDVTVYSSVHIGGFEPSVLRLEGVIELNGAGVADDTAAGTYVAGFGEGVWFGDHHDRRNPMCADIDVGSFAFEADVLTVDNADTLFGAYTQIVSSAVLVEWSDGSYVVPDFTDIFSPEVDFIDAFRFGGDVSGVPEIGEMFTFTLLDLRGRPIPGAVFTDTWNGCFQTAPTNIQGTYLSGEYLQLTWDPVDPVQGFDPANELGFYQIESSGYGANLIRVTSHQVPWKSFDGFREGVPDGNDFGVGLNEFDDGHHDISVISFAEDIGDGGVGLACQVRDEPLPIQKTGDNISVLPTP